MAKEDPFDFAAAADSDDLDLSTFAPKPRAIDRVAAEAATEVAQDAGFTRRTVKAEPRARSPSTPKSPPTAPKPSKRRVNIQDLLGIEDRYPATERAQLNLLAPVPVVLRWRQLVKEASVPAWEVLERAMEALEATSGVDGSRGRS
ncbi:MAG TPA: hypothetical protein VHY34_01905 [Caulobacteraceae bacterium]|jgi:hypothetical protein|nr:hypothetical protein [Caulobacteraceae bacterium]